MPITIWEPARYASGWATRDRFGNVPFTAPPNNGNLAAAPYNHDTKVCEIARFTGHKSKSWCDAGAFEIQTEHVTREQAKIGHMLDIDGDMYMIEGVRWQRGERGYTCTLTGRDLWAFAERQIDARRIGDTYGISSDGALTGAGLQSEIQTYFEGMQYAAGWWRDLGRFPHFCDPATAERTGGDFVQLDLQQTTAAAFKARSVGALTVSELMPFASVWRYLCNMFGVGLRFDWNYQTTGGGRGFYAITPTLYDGAAAGVEIRTDGRGVSDFAYEEDSTCAVNAVYVAFKTKNFAYFTPSYPPPYHQAAWRDFGTRTGNDSYQGYRRYVKDGSETNYPERAIFTSEKALSLGDIPEENSDTKAHIMAYVDQQAQAEYAGNASSVSFTYDNTGAYRYGEHFSLGDMLTVRDDFLGVRATQRLTTVTTNYNEGQAINYGFEFNDQRITLDNTLRRKFREIDRRSYGGAVTTS